jgi:IS5 family transposase
MFRQRRDELVNLEHPLAQLATHIYWIVFEREWVGHIPSSRPSRHLHPSDRGPAVLAAHVCLVRRGRGVGVSLEPVLAVVLWRNLVPAPAADQSEFVDALAQAHRRGRYGMEWMLTQTIKAAESARVVKPRASRK